MTPFMATSYSQNAQAIPKQNEISNIVRSILSLQTSQQITIILPIILLIIIAN